MKKALLILICLATTMAASMGLKAQEVTIMLKPGWTWICYPSADTVDFATALGAFTPLEGDIIACEYDISEYFNGEWMGDIQYFYPGYGYMYYSSRPMPVFLTFNAQHPAPQVVVTTSEPTDITPYSATSGGSITTDAYVFAKGICWATHADPTQTEDYYSENGNGDESFTAEITDLNQNTTYYVRAYAVTQNGIVYGNEVSFTTILEYEYVDLGLPSGTLWATCNVGADNPEDYGDYFAWGETQPKDNFSWTNYQYCMGSFNTLTKYCNNPDIGYNGFTDDLTTLLPEDDAATANWGDDWRMPTEGEWQELYQNTIVTWTTQNGVRGRLFTAENGNSIFLPAAGYCNESLPEAAGIIGDYWTSSLDTDYPSGALSFFFNSSNYYISFCNRLYGRNVRAVYSASFIIDATANPAEGGEVSGAGTYQEGTECALTAIPNEGYTFTNWTENGEVVSTEVIYSFIVTSDRTMVANFTYNGGVVVTTSEPTDITANSATCGGNVISVDGNYVSVLKGICWSTHSNPTFNDTYVEVGSGLGSFIASMTGLAIGTTYYVRAYAVTDAGTIFGEEKIFTTRDGIPTLTTVDVTDITTTSAICGGDITDNGGLSITDRGVCWSTSPNPTIVDPHMANGNGIGNFSSNITGLHSNTTYYVRAYATNSSTTAYGNELSFTTMTMDTPTGAIDGKFTVNEDGDQVYFSQGNLQYIGADAASPSSWRFAPQQWDVLGTTTSQNTSGGNVARDLFGWGTSRYHDANDPYNVNRMPYSISTSQVNSTYNYYGYGPSTNMIDPNLTGTSANYDWGVYNPISNGGNQTNQWRTLTQPEWNYVFNTRSTASGVRYAKANVNNVNGVILLPDDWSSSTYSLSNTNSSGASFSSNTLTASQWSTLENAGAVFLPAAGGRYGTMVSGVGSYGGYWSASYYNSECAYCVRFDNSNLGTDICYGRCNGRSVRLVHVVE